MKGAADQRRGDIKVHKDGTTWILDVGVVCPGTRRHVSEGADATPGVAAEAYAATKNARHADQHNFVTGEGSTAPASRSSTCCRAWLESQMWPLCWWMVGCRGSGP